MLAMRASPCEIVSEASAAITETTRITGVPMSRQVRSRRLSSRIAIQSAFAAIFLLSAPLDTPGSPGTALSFLKTQNLLLRSECRGSLAGRLANPRSATQLITVESSSYSSTDALLIAWRRVGSCWIARFGPWVARIGYHGFSDHKTEGDGSTPTGIFPIGDVMYGTSPNPGVHFAFHRLVCGDWWDEDSTSSKYNRFVHVTCGTEPSFRGDSEALWEETRAYPLFAVIEYNADPVRPGRGSAIFLHADVGGPTDGCVSLPLYRLETLLHWLRPSSAPVVVLGPSSEIARF